MPEILWNPFVCFCMRFHTAKFANKLGGYFLDWMGEFSNWWRHHEDVSHRRAMRWVNIPAHGDRRHCHSYRTFMTVVSEYPVIKGHNCRLWISLVVWMAGRRCPWARLLRFYSFTLLLFKISLLLLSVPPVVTAESIVFGPDGRRESAPVPSVPPILSILELNFVWQQLGRTGETRRKEGNQTEGETIHEHHSLLRPVGIKNFEGQMGEGTGEWIFYLSCKASNLYALFILSLHCLDLSSL